MFDIQQGKGFGARVAGVSPQDIAHCKTQREALVELARLNNGVVRVKDAANILRESGHAKGKATSARSTVHNLVSKDTDAWKWVEPGTFEYIGDTKPVSSVVTSRPVALPHTNNNGGTQNG